MEWLDLSSMRLERHSWRAEPSVVSPSDREFLSLAQPRMISDRVGRYPVAVEYASIDRCGMVALTNRPKSSGKRNRSDMGCRGYADLLGMLEEQAGGLDRVPPTIYIHATNFVFLRRGLLALQQMMSHAKREAVTSSYTAVTMPALPGEKPGPYEARVVRIMLDRLGGTSLRPRLDLPEIEAKIDGITWDAGNATLSIIEAKQGRRDFVEGVAQLFQYYAMARNTPRYENCHIKLFHVTAKGEMTPGYKHWQRLTTWRGNLAVHVCSSH